MIVSISRTLRTLVGAGAVFAAGFVYSASEVSAQQTYIYTPKHEFTQGDLPPGTKIKRRTTLLVERYEPTIWVDPDGCEHWVMDDGWEGFMTPHVDRNGKPVCRGNQRYRH